MYICLSDEATSKVQNQGSVGGGGGVGGEQAASLMEESEDNTPQSCNPINGYLKAARS